MILGGTLVGVLALYTVCFTVQAGTAGAVYTLGAITSVETEPGFYLKWPWPFQSVETVDTRVRLLEVVGKETPTRDEFNILVTLAAGWQVRQDKVKQFLRSFETLEEARKAVRDQIAHARKSQIQKIRLNDVISTDPRQKQRYTEFEDGIGQAVQEALDEKQTNYGIEISFLKVKRIAFSKSTIEKVFQRMINERKRRSQALIEKGNAEAEKIKDNARLERERMLSEARRDAEQIRGEGDAAAAKHYKVFKQNSELARFLWRLRSLKEILKKRSTVVLYSKDTLDDYLIDQPPATEQLKTAE